MATRYLQLLLSILLISSNGLFAADSLKVETLTTKNGLANSSVSSVFQDSYGFIWVGTLDGLQKYDGYSFKTFRNDSKDRSSLIDDQITCINEDNAKKIWIGTRKGLNILDETNNQFIPATFAANGVSQILQDFVLAIIKDKNGNMWVATAKNGIVFFDKSSGTGYVIPLKNRYKYNVKTITIDNNNNIWLFVSEIGICKFDPKSSSISIIYPIDIQTSCIKSIGNNQLLLGSGTGIYKYDIKSNAITAHYNTASSSLNCDVVQSLTYREGMIWAATDGGGLNILDSSGKQIRIFKMSDETPSLLSNAAYTTYEDQTGRMWIGTLRGGLTTIEANNSRFSNIEKNPFKTNSLSTNFILSLCEAQDDKIWIGTDGSGISIWDKKNDNFQNFRHSEKAGSLSNNYVSSILNDQNKTFWIATYGGGINRFDQNTKTFKQYYCTSKITGLRQNTAWSLYEDSQNRIWAGFFDGTLFYYDRAKDTFIPFNESLKDILTISEDSQHNLWVGDPTSICLLNTTSHSYQRFYIGSPVRAIHEDKAGNFWVGTEGKGLLKFDRKSGNFTAFTRNNGLSNNRIMRILEDNYSNLWISTFNGLNSFNVVNKKFTVYSQADGLSNTEFSYNAAIKTQEGDFIFGSLGGITLFRPETFHENVRKIPPAPLRFTKLTIDNVGIENLKEINRGTGLNELKTITIPYNQSLSLTFASLDYNSSASIKYQYYLEGADNTWKTSDESRSANYSGLREGNYIFHVRSEYGNGQWVNGKTLTIKVLPPWYRSWWSYLLYISFLSGSIYAYFIYKTRQIKLKYQIQLAHNETKKEKEITDRKIEFFTNISHEFRAPLSLIVNPLKELLNDDIGDGYANELNIVYRNAKRLLSLVDQLLLFRKSEEAEQLFISEINFSELLMEVYICFKQQADNKRINYDLQIPESEIHLFGDRGKIEIILFNLISNAIKYTPVKGSVIITVTEDNEQIYIIVSDSGPGIPPEIGEKLFQRFYQVNTRNDVSRKGFGIGLYVVKTYIDLHHASIQYRNLTGKGTEFSIAFKKGKLHYKDKTILLPKSDVKDSFLEELVTEENDVLIKGSTKIMDPNTESLSPIIDADDSILLVDDDTEILKYLKRLFSKQYRVLECNNAEEALISAKKNIPSIIISDVNLNGTSGIELCQQIKTSNSIGHIPVILLTGASSTDLKLSGIECGADDYISKPFDNKLLIARVNSIIKSKSYLQKYFFNEITLQEQTTKIAEEDRLFIENCIRIVENHILDDGFNIKILVKELGMSHSNVYKKIKSISGQTINSFIRFIRLRKAAELFITSTSNVNEILFMVGFSDQKYFRIQFNKLFGMNPSEYIKRYRKPFQSKFSLNEKLVKGKEN